MDEQEQASAAHVLSDMSEQLVDLTRALTDGSPDREALGNRVLEFAARAIPGCDEASITRTVGSSRPTTIAASGPLPLQVDEIQYETGQGPCLEALTENDVTHAADLATDDQWPAFAARVVPELGVRSMLCFRLHLTADERAALNLVATSPDAFDSLSLATGAIFASYISVTLLSHAHRAQSLNLQQALESNREIGMAMGILMARDLHTPDEAFTRLRVASQHLHRKLRDIANEVIHTGALPEHPPLRAARGLGDAASATG